MEKEYKGFLIVRCTKCGRERSFNSRAGTSEHRCIACRGLTRLKDMVEVQVRCPACGKEWRYKTNSTQAEVCTCCVNCGTEMTAVWNPTARKYIQGGKRNDR